MTHQLPVNRDEAVAFLSQYPIVLELMQKPEGEAVDGLIAWIKELPDDEAAIAISSFGAFIDPPDLLPLVEMAARVYRELAH